MTDYIAEYLRAIEAGEKIAPELVVKAYKRIQKGIAEGRYFYNENEACRSIDFVETFCRHSAGRCDLIKLELWQKAALQAIFGTVNKDGLRQFREVLIVVARKNGKTTFVAAVIAYMNYMDGEYGAEVYCLAPKLEQANIVYEAYLQMLLTDPELREMCKKRRNDIYIPATNSSTRRLAFNAKKSDGFNPHLAVCDEISSWPGEKGKRQYNVMKSAFGSRRQPLIISISTAGYEDEGIYDELVARGAAWINGLSEEEAFFPLLYVIEELKKWDDIRELKKANPNLGVSVSEKYLLEEIKIAKTSPAAKAEFFTKHCNIKQNSTQAWLKFEDVEAISGEDFGLEDFRHCYCVAGFDLSRTTDLSASGVVIERGSQLYAIVQMFITRSRFEEKIQNNEVEFAAYVEQGVLKISGDEFIDYHDIEKWFLDLVQKYKILPLCIGYDRYSAQYLVQDLESQGFKLDDVHQGTNLSPLMYDFEGYVKARTLHIGSNKLLKRHLLYTAVKIQTDSEKIAPIKLDKRENIDGFVALIDALTVRSKYFGEIGESLKNKWR